MRDDVIFETRLADALGRYADLAPAMDDEAVAREAIVAGGSPRRGGWLSYLRHGGPGGGSTARRPVLRVAYLLIVLALLLAAILVAIAGGALRNDPFRSLGRNGAIAFTVQGNNHEPAGTHVMNADGTGDHPIAADRCPSYSKDGRVLASLSYEGGAYLVVRDDAGNPTQKLLLVDEALTSVSYALSPDGARVAWFKPAAGAGTTGDSVELWVAPIARWPGDPDPAGLDCTEPVLRVPTLVARRPPRRVRELRSRRHHGERQRSAISVIADDGSGLRRLTTRPGMLGDAMSWSPDGRHLAYLGLPDGAAASTSGAQSGPSASLPRDVFVIAADGTGDRNLTDSSEAEAQPEWSPDGAVLAFETAADGEAHRLTTIHMNGPTPVGQPVLGPESEWFVWSPDGTALLWLAVTSLGPEASQSTLYSIDRDFRQSPRTVQVVDGLIVCPPSWQRLEP